MTINFRTASAAAVKRIEAASDRRVKADIDKVLRRVSARNTKERPHWVADAAEGLRQFENSRYGQVSRNGQVSQTSAPEREGGMDLVREAVVRAVGRPVYFIRDNAVDLTSARSEAAGWADILRGAAAGLDQAIPSVGRIEVDNLAGLSFVGSGWVVDDGVIVTNRHVAQYFAERDGAGFRFLIGADQKSSVRVRVDYREEYGRDAVEEVAIDRILWMPSTETPDIAFLALAAGGSFGTKRAVPLAHTTPQVNSLVGVIGYPARDFDFWDKDLLRRLFGDVYDKKRFAPGTLLQSGVDELNHDCTTLGGNSGSLLIDLASGKAVGLHFGGIALVENRAVPAAIVAQALKQAANQPTEVAPMSDPTAKPNAAPSNVLKVTIPIEVTVAVGTVAGMAAGLAPAGVVPAATDLPAGVAPAAMPLLGNPSLQQVEAAAQRARDLFGRRDGVVAIRPGYRFEGGAITKQRAVVIAVENKRSLSTLRDRGVEALPVAIDGIPIDVTNASLEEVLARAGIQEAAAPRGSNYQKRTAAQFRLDRVKERMAAILHSSPDSGWANLEPFLKRTRRRLTVGMYDFTAPHIAKGVLEAIAPATREMLMVIEQGEDLSTNTKKDDIPDEETVRKLKDEKGDKFTFSWASIRFVNGIQLKNPDGIFDSAYHIKVAVRDGKEFWLSSGNWQSSNQPPHDPRKGDEKPPMLSVYNREWHAIITHDGLSQLYEAHLRQDYKDAIAHPMPEAVLAAPETYVWIPAEYLQPELEAAKVAARYFEPLMLDRVIDVQPLLTPDNYADRILDMINGAERSIFFQNQSFKIRGNRPEPYDKLLTALKDKQDQGVDVRIIFRPFQDIRQDLENLQEFGFDVDKVRLDGKCHNKGIVVDSSAVALGSHNWTNAGTCYNRDASLIFYDREIAEFFEKIYLYDWSRARKPTINESVPAPRIARADETTPMPGMVKVKLSDLML